MKDHKKHKKSAPHSGRKNIPQLTQNPSRYWIYGTHATLAALENPDRICHKLCVSRNQQAVFEGEKKHLLSNKNIHLEVVETSFFERIFSPDAVHQGVGLEVSFLPEISIENAVLSPKTNLFLILDQITDPHNIGAILRSAAAFGVNGIIVTRKHCPPENAVIAKSASGGLELVPIIRVANLAQAMEFLKKHDFWCVGLDGTPGNKALSETSLPNKVVLVAGAEGSGLRHLTRENCDFLVKLPMHPHMESLNVSNAAAIALYEIARQQQFKW